MRALRSIVMCALALASFSSRVHAAPEDDAKAAFAEGKAAFERGEYEKALAQFHRADMILPSPKLSYNIGTCYERLGRYHDAVLSFERYLTLQGAPQDDAERTFQENLRARIATDRARAQADSRRPPPGPPPPSNPPPDTSNTQQQNSPQPPPTPLTPLEAAKKKRAEGLGLMITGGSLFVIGTTLVAVGAAITDCNAVDGCPSYGIWQITVMTLGSIGVALGLSLGIPGIPRFIEGQKALKAISPTAGAFDLPARRVEQSIRAHVFSLPPLRF